MNGTQEPEDGEDDDYQFDEEAAKKEDLHVSRELMRSSTEGGTPRAEYKRIQSPLVPQGNANNAKLENGGLEAPSSPSSEEEATSAADGVTELASSSSKGGTRTSSSRRSKRGSLFGLRKPSLLLGVGGGDKDKKDVESSEYGGEDDDRESDDDEDLPRVSSLGAIGRTGTNSGGFGGGTSSTARRTSKLSSGVPNPEVGLSGGRRTSAVPMTGYVSSSAAPAYQELDIPGLESQDHTGQHHAQAHGQPQGDSAKVPPGRRRTSFFGGLITNFGNAAGRRASRAQSQSLSKGDRASVSAHLSGVSGIGQRPISAMNPEERHLDAELGLTESTNWKQMLTLDGMPYFQNKSTGELTWDKPDELKTKYELDKESGEWVWVPHRKKIWQPARVIKHQKNGEVLCKTLKDGHKITIPAGRKMKDGFTNGRLQHVPLWPLKQSSLYIAEDDLVALDDPNEGLILHTLRSRYNQDVIYTWVGASRSVLISINPYKQLDLYSMAVVQEQRNKSLYRAPPPHVYGIANDALDSLLFSNRNNAILISGESGAGKTEATKQCLGFLAEVAGSESHVEHKILQANPLLEAFGNAKTLRNNNSSRFGKWVEVHFDPVSRSISGAQIIPYLLERSRIIFQQKRERNYHIFYQITSSQDIRHQHQLGNPAEYRYLNQSGCETIDGVYDGQELARTVSAMTELGFEPHEQEWIIKVTAGVLHLGNIDFEDTVNPTLGGSSSGAGPSSGSGSGAGSGSGSGAGNDAAAKGCKIADLHRREGNRAFAVATQSGGPGASGGPGGPGGSGGKTKVPSSYPRGSDNAKANGDDSASDNADDINDGNATSNELQGAASGKASLEAAANCLGVETKELEKVLCTRSITVRGETSVIPLSAAEARDGVDSLSMAVYSRLFTWLVDRTNDALALSKKGRFVGILDIFGFEIFEHNSYEQLCINFANEKLQQHFNATMFKEEEGLYQFEGISYSHVDFNDNQPVLDLIEARPHGVLLMLDDECRAPGGSDERLVSKVETTHAKHPKLITESKQKVGASMTFQIIHYAGTVRYDVRGFVQANTETLFSDMYKLCSSSADEGTKAMFPERKENERHRTQTVGSQFRSQLSDLMETLNSTESRYVRCIKPNEKQLASRFESPMCLEQLRYSGVFEAVQIRKQGYPFRWNHMQFAFQYRCINPGYKYKSHSEDYKALCEEIFSACPHNFRGVQIGKTRVLYRAEHHKLLMLLRNLALEKIIPWLQARVRSLQVRLFRYDLEKAEDTLQEAIDEETDIDVLDDAIAEVPEILGVRGKKLFPQNLPRNLSKAKQLKADLEAWLEMEKELEALEDDSRAPGELYFDLVAALKKADKMMHIPRTSNQDRVYERVKEMVHECKLDQLDQEAADALQAHDRELMHQVLEKAKSEFSDHDSAALEALKKELAEMDRIDEEAVKAAGKVDRTKMEGVLKESEEYNMDNEKLNKCKELLALDVKSFAEAELEVAKRDNDDSRRIHREIFLHDLFLEESGSKQFSPITECPILRDPDDYANAKLFNRLFNKAKVMDGMMKWQSKPSIPTSLLDFTLSLDDGDTVAKVRPVSPRGPEDAKLRKDAMKAFKLLHAFMGDSKPKPPELQGDDIAKQLLQMVADEKRLVAEVLMHVIKQMTNNESEESKKRGLEMLGYHVLCFQLPPAIENWVLVWLREYFTGDGAEKGKKHRELNKYMSAIRDVKYGGEPSSVPPTTLPELKSSFDGLAHSRFSLQPGQSSGPTE